MLPSSALRECSSDGRILPVEGLFLSLGWDWVRGGWGMLMPVGPALVSSRSLVRLVWCPGARGQPEGVGGLRDSHRAARAT